MTPRTMIGYGPRTSTTNPNLSLASMRDTISKFFDGWIQPRNLELAVPMLVGLMLLTGHVLSDFRVMDSCIL